MFLLAALAVKVSNLRNKFKRKDRSRIQIEDSAILFDLLPVDLFTSLSWLVCSLFCVLSSRDSLAEMEHAVKFSDVLSTCFFSLHKNERKNKSLHYLLFMFVCFARDRNSSFMSLQRRK